MAHKFGRAVQIIAGPGAGKTTQLVNRILSSRSQLGGADSAIVACTFTRKAAEELKQRLDKEVGSGPLNDGTILIGTIHSICLSLLREFVPEKYLDWDVIPEESQVPYVHSKLSMFGFDESDISGQRSWALAQQISRIFTTITDEGIDVEKCLVTPKPQHFNRKVNEDLDRVLENYGLYRSALIEDKLFDYGSIQKTLFDLLTSDQNVAHQIVDRYRQVFVDEYQDVNEIQNDIFVRLCELGASLTIVGDDDQSIYGFRGGKVEHFVRFEQRIKRLGLAPEIERLESNYRSTPQIVRATNSYIASQRYARLPKDLVAHRDVDGPEIRAIQFESDSEEAKWIVDEIVRLRTSGTITSFRSVGVLFLSVKSHAGVLLQVLKRNGVPVQAVGSGMLFEESFVEEFMALLSYWLARDTPRGDREAPLTKALQEVTRIKYQESMYFDNLDQLIETRRFYGSCLALMYDIFEATGFIARHQDHGSNLGTLTSLVFAFDTFTRRYNPYGLFSYLTFLRNQGGIDYVDDESRDAVQVSTVHRSKGLQFDVVFVASQNARHLPPPDLFNFFSDLAGRADRDLDESKRVLYVAMTRARNFAAITSSLTLYSRTKVYGWNESSRDAIRSGIQNSELSVVHLPNSEFTDFSNKEDLNPVLSYNAIRLYEVCPLQYKFSHVNRLETVRIGGMQFGVNMHRIVEQLLRRVKNGSPTSSDDIGRLIDTFWRDLPTRPNDENVKFREAGHGQLMMFVENYLGGLSPEQIAGIEEPFSLTVSNTKMVGRLDLRLQEGTESVIVDFKTGDQSDYASQLHFYAACWNKMTGEAVKQVGIYYLKTGKLQVFEPTAANDQITRVGRVADSINSGHFPASPGKHCRDCAYSAVCEFSATTKRRKSVNR